jgi:hypothetical protein
MRERPTAGSRGNAPQPLQRAHAAAVAPSAVAVNGLRCVEKVVVSAERWFVIARKIALE